MLGQEPQGLQLPALGSHKQGGDAVDILGLHLGPAAHQDLHDLQVISGDRLMQCSPAPIAAVVGVCVVSHQYPHRLCVLTLTGWTRQKTDSQGGPEDLAVYWFNSSQLPLKNAMSIPTSVNEEGETERVSDLLRVTQGVKVRTGIPT